MNDLLPWFSQVIFLMHFKIIVFDPWCTNLTGVPQNSVLPPDLL